MKRSSRWIHKIVFYFLVLSSVVLYSCTATSFLTSNESFYGGAEVKMESHGNVRHKKTVRKQMESEILTKKNTRILGMRPGVWIYFAAGNPEKKKGLGAWIRKTLGQKPILMKDVDPSRTANVLQGNLINRGYFQSRVSANVETNHKTSVVNYYTDLYPPFRIRKIHYPKPKDSVYLAVVRQIEEESYLKEGERYDLAQFKLEMERIEALLENHGFFYFDDDYLIYRADSTVGNYQVDLFLKLEENIPPKAKRIYHMDRITVVNDFDLSKDSLSHKPADTLQIDRYTYVERKDQFRPEIILNPINLETGQLYTRSDHDYTLSHLMGLGSFKFVNIKYRESATDSAKLDAEIFLTPLPKKSIQLNLQAVSKSNNFVGPGLEVTFINRNFLRGSERFQLKVNTSYEYQINNKQQQNLNAFVLDVEASLNIPRFISPINISYSSRKFIPHTNIQTGFNLQERLGFFQQQSSNIKFGYAWQETNSKSHEFYPIDFNYYKLQKTTPEFEELLQNNPNLASAFQDQFIAGGNYVFTLNTQVSDKFHRTFADAASNQDNFFLRTSLGFAGNTIWLFRDRSNGEVPHKLLGEPYSQFIIGDVDFRYYRRLDKHNMLATRLVVGVGRAYGNSTTLPYIKQFSVGGSNSIRAFPARSVGPGTYNAYEHINPGNGIYFIDQRGDIKLEGSMEYRFDIFKYVKGGLFVDAGNIWVWDDPERAEGIFNIDTFYKQLAVGTGLGIRFDFNFFVLRFDLAWPIRLPYRPEGDRWVIDEIDFGSSKWRSENLVLNIAIGYPF